MAKDYMKVLYNKHAGVSASCTGDSGVYENIDWHDTAIPKATLDSESLELDKITRHKEIDSKTQSLLDTGSFSFGGKEFKLTDRAIIRWVGVSFAEMKQMIGFPYTVTTKNYEPFILNSKTELDTFFGTGLASAEAIEKTGRDLHALINSATTEAELDAVIDTRT